MRKRARIRWTMAAIMAGSLTLTVLNIDWTSVMDEMKGDPSPHSHSMAATSYTKAEAKAAMRQYGLSRERAKNLAQQYGITKESLQ